MHNICVLSSSYPQETMPDEDVDLEDDQNIIESIGVEVSIVHSSSAEDISSPTLISPSARIASTTPVSRSPSTSTSKSHSTKGSTRITKTKKKKAEATKRKAGDELLRLLRDRLQMPVEDEHDFFAKAIAFKLRKLNPGQCFYAEKLINDVLYEAGLGELNRLSCVMAIPASMTIAQDGVFVQEEVQASLPT